MVEAYLGLAPVQIAIHWVWRLHNDPGHRWLRELVHEVLDEPAAALPECLPPAALPTQAA